MLPVLMLVCAAWPLERLPAGTAIGTTPAFVAKAREITAKAPTAFERSPYQTQDFPAVWDQRVEWADGSQISVSCTLKATLHQVEHGTFTVSRTTAKTVTSPYFGPGQPPEWLKVTYELSDGEIDFPASLTCEVASARKDAAHPYASADKQHVAIGVLESLLAETLPLRIRTETEPRKCAALP